MAVGTFDTDSMPNLYSVSPKLNEVPSVSVILSPNSSGSIFAR